MGDLIRPTPEGKFLYARYDKVFSGDDLLDAEKVTRRGFTLDNLELMDFLIECGTSDAEKAVKLCHFDGL